MNPRDAISATDLEGGDWTPTYFCEDCGKELHYPPATGRCDACDDERADLLTVDLGLHCEL